MSFFRQGSWMIFCNTLAGVLMFGVHFLALSVLTEAGDYGLFGALLGILTLMMSATPGIQTVFTHEAAAATSDEERQRMTYYAYGVIKLTFVLWLVFVGLIALFHRSVFAFYKMDQAWPLIITLVAGLLVIWLPVFMGILQGAQRFSWLGWALLANGGGRLIFAFLLALIFGGSTQSVMLGVLAGVVIALLMSFSIARPYLVKNKDITCQWGKWLRGVLPLALAPVVFQMMMSADTIFFRALMSKTESSYYALAGTLGRGLFMLLGPLAGVMFPKLVKSHREGQSSSILISTLTGTLILGGIVFGFFLSLSWGWPHLIEFMRGMQGTSMLDGLAQRVVSKEEGLSVVLDLLPWFSAAMLFLSCSNVLLSNLLAFKRYRVLFVPFIVVVAYLASLALLPSNGKELVQLIFLFNVTLLLVLISLVWWTGTWQIKVAMAKDRVNSNE
jgi:O-antigen/teichoic acid export membrane protein